ncbi:hypothetical protein JXB11_00290 [Candidatus Woesearchaeota archaeon]|nr:hypothetical protein [Candidatus Woesearchaeota archaeon]
MKPKRINMSPDKTYKSRLLKYAKLQIGEGEAIFIRVWRIAEDCDYPEGFKYSFTYIKGGKRVLGYDNFEGKGHHKHSGREEVKIEFSSINEIEKSFKEEVRRLRGRK